MNKSQAQSYNQDNREKDLPSEELSLINLSGLYANDYQQYTANLNLKFKYDHLSIPKDNYCTKNCFKCKLYYNKNELHFCNLNTKKFFHNMLVDNTINIHFNIEKVIKLKKESIGKSIKRYNLRKILKNKGK